MRKNTKFRKGNGKVEKDNYQDEAEVKEYKKGFRAGKTKERKGGNAASWEMGSYPMARDTANITWTQVQGLPITIDSLGFTTGGFFQTTVPGICALDVAPVIGQAKDERSAINVAAMAMYSYVRHTNSGSANYDPADMMMYVYGMCNIYSNIIFVQRAFGYYDAYENMNRYYPYAMLNAMGIDIQSILSNIVQVKSRINLLISKAAAFAVPAEFTIFKRQAFLYKDVYAESNDIMDQLYLMRPAGYYMFSNYASDKGSSLVWNAFDWSQPQDINYVLDIIDQQIEVFLSTQAIGNMSGDILKAYGNNIIKLAYIEDGFRLKPIFDETTLEMIQNAIVLPDLEPTIDQSLQVLENTVIGDITQEYGTVESPVIPRIQQNCAINIDFRQYSQSNDDAANMPSFLAEYIKAYRKTSLLNTANPNPNAANVIEMTSLMPAFGEVSIDTSVKVGIAELIPRSEVVVGARLYTNLTLGNAKIDKFKSYAYQIYASDGSRSHIVDTTGVPPFILFGNDNLPTFMTLYSRLGKFDYAPRFEPWFVQYNVTTGSYSQQEIKGAGDLDTYTVIEQNVLGLLNSYCIMDLFHVSGIGMSNTL